MRCLDEPSVLAIAEGRVPAAERAQIDAHIDQCAACLELIVHAARFAAGSAPTEAGASGSAGATDAIAATARYELGDEIARGGMGRIFEARDRVLGRAVAIKCVREDRPALEGRFEREVALTARLQHPAIVPIHDAGRLPDGRRFYAMRRIGGKPLDRRIAEAQGAAERLALLPHVIALVDAMAYVHSQGVIHRDLKPHNVLCGEFGETVLVDWGLAKHVAEPEAAGGASIDDDGAATLDGEIIGTRGYMAPEQAAGKSVDARADVHGLGATLLHVITGQPPHAARDLTDVPADLAAIVARAMAPDPEERYPSARELADDLHRFQTGRLVQAHHYSARQLIVRWFVRHRRAVALAAAALIAVAVVAIVAVVRIVDEREVARTERAHAETQRDAAQSLVAFVLGKLRDELEQVGRLDALSGAASEVVSYYDRVERLTERPGDRLHRAMAIGLLGQTRRESGDSAGALELYRRSVELARAADERNPDGQAQEELCRSLFHLGQVGHPLGAADAIGALRECETIARSHLATAGDTAAWQWLLAQVTVELATEAMDRGDDAAAQPLLEEAQRTGEALEAAGDPRGARAIATACGRLSQLQMEQDHWTEAAATVDTLLAAARRDAGRRPYDTAAQIALAVAWQRTGDVRDRQRDVAGAEAAYRETHRIMSALVALEPRSVRWNRLLGSAEERLGQLAQSTRDREASLAHLRASRDISARLVDQEPRNWPLVTELATSDLNLGDALLDFGEHDLARSSYTRAIDLYHQVEREAPGAEATQSVAMAELHLGNLEVAAHRPAAARAALERSLDLCREVLAGADTPYNRRLVGDTLVLLAEVAPERAAERLTDAAEVTRPLRELADGDPEIRELIADIDRRRARVARTR